MEITFRKFSSLESKSSRIPSASVDAFGGKVVMYNFFRKEVKEVRLLLYTVCQMSRVE